MAPVRRRKACKECRLQKIRCDAEPPAICSRCRRMDLECVLASNPNARRTKAELQRQLETMNRGDANMAEAESTMTSSSVHPASTGIGSSMSHSPSTSDNTHQSPAAGRSISTASASDLCSSRVFDGQVISSRKISDCFALFFQDYANISPVLGCRIGPDECYHSSPFLFWAIVYLGSRRYTQDPTLLTRLVTKINTMALQALESRTNPIPTIQGLLMLSCWPVPVNTLQKDISYTLSSAAIHLAMQIGLHVAGTGQDFARTKIDVNPEQTSVRAQLWMHCAMTYHCNGLRDGVPPLISADSFPNEHEGSKVIEQIHPDIRFRWKLHNILLSASLSIRGSFGRPASSTIGTPLASLISLFDSQLTALIPEAMNTSNMMYVDTSRLHLLAYYFLDDLSSMKHEGLVTLYAVSCRLIDSFFAVDETTGMAGLFPSFLTRAPLFAAFCILKVHRSELSRHVDLEAGERSYFNAILLARKSSRQNDDLEARSATIMSQLWTSKRIFRRSDGTISSLDSRIRSRLSISIVFDCFWWWREEFAGLSSPYNGDDTDDKAPPAPRALQATPDSQEQQAMQMQPMMMNGQVSMAPALGVPDEPFPDYDWAANFDFNDFNWTAIDTFAGPAT